MDMDRTPPENTPRVIVLAAVFFGSAAALGWSAGVFERLSGGELAALGAFAAAFAALTVAVDAQVRAALKAAIQAMGTWLVTWREAGRAARSAYQRSR